MTPGPMHSLSFAMRHADEFFSLYEKGHEPAEGVIPAEWETFWRVAERALAQRTEVLEIGLGRLEADLKGSGLRFEPVTRAAALAMKWEAWGRVYPARLRTPAGHLGISLGLDLQDETSLQVWWGYAKARAIRGPALAEALRARHPHVRMARVASGFPRGTVLLGDLDLAIPRTLAQCSELFAKTAELLARERDEILKV